MKQNNSDKKTNRNGRVDLGHIDHLTAAAPVKLSMGTTSVNKKEKASNQSDREGISNKKKFSAAK